jgi:PAS domain S-box-containing protein
VQATNRYAILSLLEAVLGAVVCGVIALGYKLGDAQLAASSLAVTIAGLGALAVLYYLSIHQLLKHKSAQVSAIVLSCISALTILLVVLATGGLDSPYLSLWLLAIVVAGIFGTTATGTVAGATVVVYIYEFITHRSHTGYFVDHLGQVAVTLVTAGIAEWIHMALGRGVAQRQRATALAGKLDAETLKSSALMQSMGEGVLVIDDEHRIQLFNPAATTLTGWDEKSAQGIDYRLVLNLHDAQGKKLGSLNDPFKPIWHGEHNVVLNDLTMQTKSDRSVAVSLSLSPIYGPDQKVNGGIALFRDISAEKEVERQRDEFISTASHEMRTPVAAIEGYLSLTMNPAVATIDNRAMGYLEKAHNSTQHLGELFRDLLSVTKLEDSSKVKTTELFDLTQMTKEALSDMEFTAQKKKIEMQFGTAEGGVRSEHTVLPIYVVRGNPQRLREVIMNLMENAIKFTPEGGQIHVSIGGTNDSVTVSVTDSGIGIAPEDIPHLFQKFYRIDSTATRTIGGTGLGLYLSRTIIELLGGKIWVESKLGFGSSFKFSLPRQPTASLSQQPATGPSAAVPVPAPAPATPPLTAPLPAATTTASPSMLDIKKPVVAQ